MTGFISDPESCVPRGVPQIEIRGVDLPEGAEPMMGRICQEKPLVIHSNRTVLKLTFKWNPGQVTGFRLIYKLEKGK